MSSPPEQQRNLWGSLTPKKKHSHKRIKYIKKKPLSPKFLEEKDKSNLNIIRGESS